MVADRALRAAEDADDPIRIAAASWNMGHVMLSDPHEGAVEEAADIALSAIETLSRGKETREARAMAGALQLVAVVASAVAASGGEPATDSPTRRAASVTARVRGTFSTRCSALPTSLCTR